MIKEYGRNLVLNSSSGPPSVALKQTPGAVLDALSTLIEAWPNLVTGLGPVDLPANCFALKRSAGQLTISLHPAICSNFGVEGLPIHIAARFERVADYAYSFSEIIRLQAVQTQMSAAPVLTYSIDQMGASVSEVIDLLTLKGKHTQQAALQLCLQLVFVFRIRTVGQLALWLIQALNPESQLVTDAHTKALIETFWHWSTPNFLWLMYEVLTHQGVTFSDPALFLYYTKLTTMLEDDAMLTSDKSDVDMRGRLKLPLTRNATPNIVPTRWLRKFARMAEDARERMGGELVSTQTEPSLWTSTNTDDG
ncbi:MAG: hypothetical protein HC853_00240 [Anaerolineae bacterium]|nr:hypothetical protein [Anaerolineae bacterium]